MEIFGSNIQQCTADERMMDRRPDKPFERFFQLCPFVHETCEYVRLFMVDSAPILSPLSLSSSANNKWVKIFLKTFIELICGDTKFSETVLWTKWVSNFGQSEILLPSQWKKNSLMKIYSNVQSYVLSVKLTITATKYGN